MKVKFVVKLEEHSSSNRFLTKNVDVFNTVVPYGFKHFQFKHDIAYFNTKEEAIEACEESFKYAGTEGLPVILEVIVRE